MFQVITGSFRELETSFLRELQQLKEKDPLSNILVLSPSGRLLTHLQRQSATQNPGYLNIHCLTFYALAERLLSDAGYTEPVVSEPALYQELIRSILTGKNPEPVDHYIRAAFHRNEGSPVSKGLTGALSSTLRDMRDSGIRADYALQAANEGFLGAQAPEAASTLALYARVTGLLEKFQLKTSADLLRRAAERASKHPWISEQKAILLYGFYDLTGVQLDLVLSLADHSDARVYYPFEKNNPHFTYAEKLLNDSAFVSKVSHVGRNETVVGNKVLLSPTTYHVTTDVWSCSGSRDEVWLISKEILKLADNGVSFDAIAVVARNLAPYLLPLREIFSAHHIPYNCSRLESAGSQPLIKTVRALITFDRRLPNAKTIQEDLRKSPYFNSAQPIKSILHDDIQGTIDQSSWAVHILWAKALLVESIRLPHDANPLELALLSQITGAIDDLDILDRLGETVNRKTFIERLGEKLETLEIPATEKPHRGVQVLEVQQARGLSFRTVFIPGMNEKVFPRLIREDPFLSDGARSALAQATGARLGRKLDGYEEEQLLFEITRQSATDNVYLLTQRSDENGKALIPSAYLKKLEREAGAPAPKSLRRSFAAKFENRAPLSWTPKELSFLMNRAHLNPQEIYKALRWNAPEYDRLLAAHHALERFRPGVGEYDGHIEDLSLLKTVLSKPFSPTSLEDLAECPHQYYSANVLRIKPPEEMGPDGEISPKALGKLFHRTLELFYTTCRDLGFPGTDLELVKQLNESLEGCFIESADQLSTIYPLALKAIKKLIYQELLAFIKSDIAEFSASGFRPQWFEQPLEGTLPLPLTYRFFGKPDRMDVRESEGLREVRVVDYKSGKPKPWTGRIETHLIQGKFLQLPVYLGLAGPFAQKTLGHPATGTDATLRPVRETDEEATEKTLTADFWTSPSAPVFTENLKELIGIIEKGMFYIEPSIGEHGYCARCDFAKVCRKEHMPTRIRAERDPLRVRINDKLARTAPPLEKKKEKVTRG